MRISQIDKLTVFISFVPGTGACWCSGGPTTKDDLVMKSIIGMKMKYSDWPGDYMVTFKQNGELLLPINS
jgi:hypothetical protein